MNLGPVVVGYGAVSRSEDPTRIGDILLIALGIALLLLAIPFGIGAMVSLGADEDGLHPFRLSAILLLGGLALAMVAAGYQLIRRHLKELLEEDDYQGPRWPDVTVKEERRLRLAARREKRRS